MMGLLLRSIGAVGGTVGFCYMLDAPRKTIFPASVIALASYLIYELMAVGLGQSLIFSYFFALLDSKNNAQELSKSIAPLNISEMIIVV